MESKETNVIAQPSVPTELYTMKTMFTLGGSSAGVWLFTTILALVFNVDVDKYKWIGLCVALALSFIGAITVEKFNLRLAMVAFFNGLLIYVTAVGINSINQGVSHNKDISKASLIIPSNLDKPWWPAADLVDSIQFLNKEYKKAVAMKGLLETSNKVLTDSLTLLKTELASLSSKSNGCDEVKKCLAENKNLKDEILRLKMSLEKAGSTKRGDVSDRKSDDKSVQLLNELKSLNSELLKNLNKYLDAGSLDTRTQVVALRSANEKVFDLRQEINEYNSKIDALLKQ